MKYAWLIYGIISLAICISDLITGDYGWAVAMVFCTVIGFGEAIKYRKEKR